MRQPASGARRVLFSGLVGTESLEQSPDGQSYALSDGKNAYVTSKAGAHKRRLSVGMEADYSYRTDFLFGSTGSRLAVLNLYSYGEPATNEVESLWAADTRSGKATSLASWYTSVPPYHDETSVFHFIEGWTSDSKSVVVRAEISSDSKYGFRSDWSQVWAYSLTGPKNKGRKLFDSGPGCLAITWYPGK